MDVAAPFEAIRDWRPVQIPGGAEDLDQLVHDGKTMHDSIEVTSKLPPLKLQLTAERSATCTGCFRLFQAWHGDAC